MTNRVDRVLANASRVRGDVWARGTLVERVEILGYCDGRASVDWISAVGGQVMNLLVKGSEKHCRGQLGLSPDVHRERVRESVSRAQRKKLKVNVYLEDWSNGVRDSFDYVFAMTALLRELGVARVYLPDTLGILAPETVTRYVADDRTWPDVRLSITGQQTTASPPPSPPP